MQTGPFDRVRRHPCGNGCTGDCGEYTTVMVALLRAMGIPARRATGRLYDFDTLSAHAWVEVALPKRSGELHWFVADPTLAGTTAIEKEKAAYVQFNDPFFAGEPAYLNLELIYIRDRHSDRLHTLSLRFGRYLVEHSLARILKRLTKGGLLTEDETARIAAIAEASNGKNLYLLQELARLLPAGE